MVRCLQNTFLNIRVVAAEILYSFAIVIIEYSRNLSSKGASCVFCLVFSDSECTVKYFVESLILGIELYMQVRFQEGLYEYIL